MSEVILQALGKLDPNNENHWTGDGLPRVETVQYLAADQSITRGAITEAAPNFTREAALQASGAVNQTNGVAGSSDGGGVTPDIKEGVKGTSENEVDKDVTLLEALTKERETLAKMREILREAKKELDAQETLVADMEAEYEASKPVENTQTAIMGYLESQRIQREKRAERVQELLGQGIDKKLVSSALRSPLDNAKAGKK